MKNYREYHEEDPAMELIAISSWQVIPEVKGIKECSYCGRAPALCNWEVGSVRNGFSWPFVHPKRLVPQEDDFCQSCGDPRPCKCSHRYV